MANFLPITLAAVLMLWKVSGECQCGIFLRGADDIAIQEIYLGATYPQNCERLEVDQICRDFCFQKFVNITANGNLNAVSPVFNVVSGGIFCENLRREISNQGVAGYYRWCQTSWKYVGIQANEKLCCTPAGQHISCQTENIETTQEATTATTSIDCSSSPPANDVISDLSTITTKEVTATEAIASDAIISSSSQTLETTEGTTGSPEVTRQRRDEESHNNIMEDPFQRIVDEVIITTAEVVATESTQADQTSETVSDVTMNMTAAQWEHQYSSTTESNVEVVTSQSDDATPDERDRRSVDEDWEAVNTTDANVEVVTSQSDDATPVSRARRSVDDVSEDWEAVNTTDANVEVVTSQSDDATPVSRARRSVDDVSEDWEAVNTTDANVEVVTSQSDDATPVSRARRSVDDVSEDWEASNTTDSNVEEVTSQSDDATIGARERRSVDDVSEDWEAANTTESNVEVVTSQSDDATIGARERRSVDDVSEDLEVAVTSEAPGEVNATENNTREIMREIYASFLSGRNGTANETAASGTEDRIDRGLLSDLFKTVGNILVSPFKVKKPTTTQSDETTTKIADDDVATTAATVATTDASLTTPIQNDDIVTLATLVATARFFDIFTSKPFAPVSTTTGSVDSSTSFDDVDHAIFSTYPSLVSSDDQSTTVNFDDVTEKFDDSTPSS